MWKVEVWVPTKGWRQVYRGKCETDARAYFALFQPLEVQLSQDGRPVEWAGVCHQGMYDMEDRIKAKTVYPT